MSAVVDFSRAREPLVAAIEGAMAGQPASNESLRGYLAALPGSTRKTEAGQADKLELGAEAKALLELAFRSCLDHRVRTHKGSVESIGPLLDMTLWAADEGFVEASLPMVLVAELFESQTLAATEQSFLLLEQRAERIAALCRAPGRTTKLILLRLTVDLLKRLSKTNNAEFNGRVLMWLAYVLPLSERSGVNLKSESNTANVTVYEEDLDAKQLEGVEGPSIDPGLYKSFWSLQHYIHNCQLLFKGEHWTAFTKAMEAVLGTFATIPVAEGGKGTDELCFTTKYLTSSRLLKLQFKDPTFRRHFLTQTLLLLHSLQVPVQKAGPGVTVFQVKDKQKAVVLDFARRARELLEKTPPQGGKFSEALTKLLLRENQWVAWKRDACPPLERPVPAAAGVAPAATAAPAPAAATVAAPAPAAATVVPSASTSSVESAPVAAGAKRKRPEGYTPRIPLGNAELARLWKLPSNRAAIERSDSSGMPSLMKYMETLRDEADPDAGMEEPYKSKNNKVWTWKAMRLITRQAPHLIGKIKNGDLDSLLPHLFGTPEKQQAPADNGAIDEKATEEEMQAACKGADGADGEEEKPAVAPAAENEEMADAPDAVEAPAAEGAEAAQGDATDAESSKSGDAAEKKEEAAVTEAMTDAAPAAAAAPAPAPEPAATEVMTDAAPALAPAATPEPAPAPAPAEAVANGGVAMVEAEERPST